MKVGYEAKRRIKIVVIDSSNVFPLKRFIDLGYRIEKWNFVEDYGRLESGEFDIIVSDLFNVAKDISHDDGLGVISSLKRRDRSQLIIASCSQSVEFSKGRFLHLEDAKLPGLSDFLIVKNCFDDLITKKITTEGYRRL